MNTSDINSVTTINQVFHRCVFVQRSELVDGFFRAGFLTCKQVLYGSIALGVANLRIAGVLVLHKVSVMDFIELPFHIREGCYQIVWVLWVKSSAETMEAVPVDVTFSSFRVNVLAVGKVETAVVVLGVVSAVGSGSSVVSC